MFTTTLNMFVQSLESRRLMSAAIKPVAQPTEELPARNEMTMDATATVASSSLVTRGQMHAVDLAFSETSVSDHIVSDL
jgi:hypothetical protein